MTYADGRFLLVREEEDKGAKNWRTRTVARVLEVGKPPVIHAVVRPAEPGDDRRFFDSILTADGQHYLWLGPRLPLQNLRVEVREVSTGRLIRRIVRSVNPTGHHFLDPRARDLWIKRTAESFHFDLVDADRPGDRVSAIPQAVSPDDVWLAYIEPTSPTDPTPELILRPRAEDKVWLHLLNDDLSRPRVAQFSSDGRFLAWGSQDGMITMADLESLRREVGLLEESLELK
jgi:hypothetical protein